MHLQIITLYCLCADFLVAYGHKQDPQTRMTGAEVMTAALVAAWFFHGNQALACRFLAEHGYLPRMLPPGRFNRRLHALPEVLWLALLTLLAQLARAADPNGVYAVDSVPTPVCHNIRLRRCRRYRGRAWRGYCASKRQSYFGLKAHVVVAATGQPVEVVLTPASEHDLTGLKRLPLDLPEGSEVAGDAAYTDYLFEDTSREVAGIELTAARKSNSKRPRPGWVTYLCQRYRKRIETTFSALTERFGHHIHAVTPRGTELKVFLIVLAYAVRA